ncbi:A-kinase-interacting protein 1 [Gouania willdenowi]|nr:A-kinase-interacting protein 1 [Gouania willdenowi]XP_028306612.1 A-kinase-interacting protein 1 [Gouania willdenowi]
MADRGWLETSLRRSARLGLEVLERASRRSVDWATITASVREEDPSPAAERTSTELSDAFTSIAEFMVQTTHQCQRFYKSGCCSEPSEAEKKHVSRFHSQPGAGNMTSAPATKKHRVSAVDEDFYIEVSPGTYAVTASILESPHQTQLVSVKAGESINLTFDL